MIFNKPKNVETITAKLHDTVVELEAHAEDQLQRADNQAWVANAANQACEAHKSEHHLAKAVASNIKALLNG